MLDGCEYIQTYHEFEQTLGESEWQGSPLCCSPWDCKDTGFPGVSGVRNPPAHEGDVGSIPGLGRSSGGENGNPLQYSCLGYPMDRGAWLATAMGLQKSQTGFVSKQPGQQQYQDTEELKDTYIPQRDVTFVIACANVESSVW